MEEKLGSTLLLTVHHGTDGDGVRRDISKGVKYLQLASHGGNVMHEVVM